MKIAEDSDWDIGPTNNKRCCILIVLELNELFHYISKNLAIKWQFILTSRKNQHLLFLASGKKRENQSLLCVTFSKNCTLRKTKLIWNGGNNFVFQSFLIIYCPSVCKLFTFSSSSPEQLGKFSLEWVQSILGEEDISMLKWRVMPFYKGR